MKPKTADAKKNEKSRREKFAIFRLKMIEPRYRDLGRRVIFRRGEGPSQETGIVTSFDDDHVFVHFDLEPTGETTPMLRANLDWARQGETTGQGPFRSDQIRRLESYGLALAGRSPERSLKSRPRPR